MKRSLYILVSLLPLTCLAQQASVPDPHDEYLCETALSVSSPIENIAIVGNSSILKTGLSASFSWLKLRNDTESALVEYAMLLEVFDASHARIYGVIFHDVYSESPATIYPPYKGSSAPFRMSPVYPVNSVIEPGATSELLVAMTPLVSSRCPASARFSFIFLKFANGKTVTYSLPGWRTDPALAIPTDHLVLGDCPVPKGIGTSAVVSLDSEGNVQAVSLRGLGLSPTLGKCLRRELGLWEFEPAIVEGQAVASQLRLVVLFDPSDERWRRWEREYAREVAEGVSLLALRPSDSKEGEWDFGYGSPCCFTANKLHPSSK